MSSSDVAISVRGLSKVYTINHNGLKKPSFREVVVDKVKHPFRKSKTEILALKDVSFEVKKGDVVGIIGRNGAGKSTLLKIMSRIAEPTCGEVDLYGRVGSLLEVGTGFHPELTGRENVYLNGAILGMRREEIKKQFDAIVDFAEVEKFLDTPVKRYSSGMYVRLAFAVAAHLNPEILIVDEVLAVGDAQFQKKCLGKIGEVAKGGRTVLFVSHNIAAVEALCTEAALLMGGKLAINGPVQEVISKYRRNTAQSWSIDIRDRRDRTGNGALRCVGVHILGDKGEGANTISVGQTFSIRIDYKAAQRVGSFGASIDLETTSGVRVATLWTGFLNRWFNTTNGGGSLNCEVRGLNLRPDTYVLSVGLGTDKETFDNIRDVATLDIAEEDFYGCGRLPSREHGIILPEYEWTAG